MKGDNPPYIVVCNCEVLRYCFSVSQARIFVRNTKKTHPNHEKMYIFKEVRPWTLLFYQVSLSLPNYNYVV